MAKQAALNIVQVVDGTTASELAVLQNQVIENIEKAAVSVFLKNRELSGNPEAGSVEAKRFKNSASATYGTARTAGAGSKVNEGIVTILLDKDKEIVEEFEKKDIVAYGIPALMERRAANHARSMIRELDRAFFLEAFSEGSEFTPTVTAIREQLEELIVKVEITQNNFVDGVERDDIALTLDVATHSLLRNEIDELPVSHIDTAAGAVGMWHGVVVFVSNRMPASCFAMAMVYGSVAQPVLLKDYAVDKIPLSNAYGVSLFYNYGTKAVTEDLIQYASYLGMDIASAQALHDGATEGTSEGEYAVDSKATLLAAIVAAQAVADSGTATAAEVVAEKATLAAAVLAFEEGIVTA